MSRENKEQASGGLSRRQMFDRAALASLGLAAIPAAAAAADGTQFEPLPNFKFNIESQRGWQGEGGSAKEATVAEFPVSQSIAGVSMRLKPGGIRELHWHSLAAEWAYMLEGRCRATVISPNGQSEITDFGPGDTWYFPRGHGHALQGLGPGECHFLLGFDNGHFSEYGTFSITDWVASTPPHIVSRNLGISEAEIARLPKKEVYIGTGKVPETAIEPLRDAGLQPSQSSHKYRLDMQPPRQFPGGLEYMVTAREFPIQTTLTAVKMLLQPGALRELHWHPHADEWQYYVRGRARVGVFGSHGRARTEEFGPGDIAFINQGHGHYIEQVGDEPTEVLILFNSGEYQEISLANWLGANPVSLLMDNFQAPRELVERFPKKETGIFGRKG
ncbi:MAG TPA: cupin domain-containing protein [Bryobacteraceae bacterium]|jgi:oxalate decarboxylase|nr:cupin domain-containing protein [Bryobacteraceae bacterium]